MLFGKDVEMAHSSDSSMELLHNAICVGKGYGSSTIIFYSANDPFPTVCRQNLYLFSTIFLHLDSACRAFL